MSNTNRKLINAFRKYFLVRVYMAGAITPKQKKDLINQLRRELVDSGRIPLPSGPVKINSYARLSALSLHATR